MGKIITIAQQKGGAGKTTLACQLAVALEKTGASVATIDIDPQGSLSLWYAARMHSLGDKNRLVHTQVQGWRLKKEVDRLSQEFDYVVVDSPPHAETEATIAIRAADIVLIPMQPSPMDLWASKPTIQTAQNEGSEAMIVLNRVAPRTKLNTAIIDKLDMLEAKVAKQAIGSRVAFAASMMDGLGVVETEPSGAAAKEVTALVKEIIQKYKKSSRKAA